MNIEKSLESVPATLTEAKPIALRFIQSNDWNSADLVMLSAYHATIEESSWWFIKVCYVLCALRHARRLEKIKTVVELNSGQLRVLLEFFLLVRRDMRVLWLLYPSRDKMLFLTKKMIGKSEDTKPYERAMVRITAANVCKLFPDSEDRTADSASVIDYTRSAYRLGGAMRTEGLEGVIKFIRVLEMIADFWLPDQPLNAYPYLKEALILAQKEFGAEGEKYVLQIRARMHKIEIEREESTAK